jgi:DNA-binding HxlR family transcriptional regulator
MSGIPTKATMPAVRAMLATSGADGMVKHELSRRMQVGSRIISQRLSELHQAGQVVVQRRGKDSYYIDVDALRKAEAPVVPPFKWDRWTKPLQGYDARMQAAMTMRSA